MFSFLTGQAKDIATYGSNPLWHTVDGSWELNQYQSDGYTQFKSNPAYSGPDNHDIQYFVEEPFTSDTAELDVLRSGGTINYGYLPPQDAAQSGALAAEGYKQVVWNSWGITYFVFNFNNPTVGPIFAQAYLRQAMQSLVDEQAFIKGPLNSFGHTDYGPVPSVPTTYATPYEIKGPWPYNPAKSVGMLKSHGWDVKPNGVTTCAIPSRCGAGISNGTKLEFNLAYASGNVVTSEEMQALKSNFSAAGIDINLSSAPFDTIISESAPCTRSQAPCSWEMANWGEGTAFGVNPYPTGDLYFLTGSGGNFSNYSSPTADKLISATVHGAASLAVYENYLADQIPVLWMPEAPYSISEISNKLQGAVPQSPIESLTPEDWSLSK